MADFQNFKITPSGTVNVTVPRYLLSCDVCNSRNVAKSNFPPLEERFWSKVNKTENCWNWIANSRGSNGYGGFWYEGKNLFAHRFSYELHYGKIPENMKVLHICDNPKCVRPDH